MSKRYGRNQKRIARNRIAELEAELAAANARAAAQTHRALVAEYDLARGTERAFAEYAQQHELIQSLTIEIGDSLGRMLGEELTPYAERLLAVARNRPTKTEAAFALHLLGGPSNVNYITGEIERLSFSVAFLESRRG